MYDHILLPTTVLLLLLLFTASDTATSEQYPTSFPSIMLG